MKRKPDQAHQLTDKALAALEKRIAALYGEAAKELTGTVEAYFETFEKRDAAQRQLIGTIVNGREYTENDYKLWRLAQIGRGKRFEALRDRVAERYTQANEVAAAYMNDATPGVYSLNRNYAAYTIEQQVGRNVGFDLWDEQTVRRLVVEEPGLMPYYPKERAVRRGIDLDWGKRQITATVTSSILQGKSIKGISDELQRRMPEMNRTSAIRAARTAVTGAQNAGRMDGYAAAEKMGIRVKKQWMATLDGRTRHAHAMLDGQTQERDKPFTSELGEIMYPGDPNAAPANIYNCRCTLVADVGGAGTEKRRARDPVTGESGVVENMTYAQWAAIKQERQKTVETYTILSYNETIKEHISIDSKAVFDAAKGGGKHKGVYVDAMRHKQKNLEKSISSHTAQVVEHADKIASPEKYDTGWGEKDERQREGLLKKWKKDLQRNAEQAEIEIEVWKERFGNEP